MPAAHLPAGLVDEDWGRRYGSPVRLGTLWWKPGSSSSMGGQQKAHLQHVFTAIAVNIERLSGLPPTGEDRPPRRPTAFQNFLDRHGIPRHKS
ncbi:hypothetical protein [Streptomyces mirabilis]|uniref:hypothetical protein n=1 Tax=Streptomyces mirabilis TaxID=68239 RepID=UPI0036EEB0DF